MVLSMTAWCSWQVLAVVHHVVMLLCFLAALIWSEATKYNLLREQMVLNMTGKDSTFMAEWKYLTRWDHVSFNCFKAV